MSDPGVTDAPLTRLEHLRAIDARVVADGMHLFLEELPRRSPEARRALMLELWRHIGDEQDRRIGARIKAFIGAGLLAAALAIAVGWSRK